VREALAERLLANVMGWSPEQVAEERPLLQDLAVYKYDEYQQFSTGMHFVERLAVWLGQFSQGLDRQEAYDFIKRNLLFISEPEVRHLVSLAYPDIVKPVLLAKVASQTGIPDFLVGRLANHEIFPRLRRRSLFLGLSDGARMDVLRRLGRLDNEQVCAGYQLSLDKCKDLIDELNKSEKVKDARFQTLFLLDDFSGSGDSLFRMEKGKLKGKIHACLETLLRENQTTGLFDVDLLHVHVILYLATQRALSDLRDRISQYSPSNWPTCDVRSVYTISDSVRVTHEKEPKFDAILKKYYDPDIMDRHLLKGGLDVIHGYAGCSLPLVLNHNTPNNSIYLLWANREDIKPIGLFPRVSRHREEL
jgi:hypothetical protein